MSFIKVENISFKYSEDTDKCVLENLSLSVEKGSFVAILGHNGSGKSTLAKHFNGIIIPDSGRVLVNGMDTASEEHILDIRKTVGMVFQNPDNQIVATIVEDDVAFAPENLGVPHDELRDRVDGALESVSMKDYSLSAPHELSGGQKQRVAIAGIIAMKPECIVLDESTAMLDPKGRREVMSVIKKLNREAGITVVLITHYMEEAAEADRVVVINKGEIVLDGTPREVMTEVETMEKIGLDVPQATRLSYLLRGTEAALPRDILTAEECAEAIKEVLRKKGRL